MGKWLAYIGRHRRIGYPIAGLVVLFGLSAGVLAETGALPAATTPSPSASASAQADSGTAGNTPGLPAAGGAVNIVQVSNTTNNDLDAKAKDQLSEIGGPDVAPQNVALALSSCIDCTTVAVAVQIVLVKSNPPNFQPHNSAVAVNAGCTGCTTCAIALQQVIQVSDPTVVPASVRQEAAQVHQEVSTVAQTVPGTGLQKCQGIADWASNVLESQMDQIAPTDFKRDLQTIPTTPGASPMAPTSPSPTVTGSPTASPTPTPSASTSP